MLIFDQLKKSDPALRALTVIILAGLVTLVAGLWWIQVISARDYQAHLETQSFRTIRIPAVRGKILDRNGAVLAENKPTYNLCLYLDEVRKPVDEIYTRSVNELKARKQKLQAAREQQLGRSLTKVEKSYFAITRDERIELKQLARYTVGSNLVAAVAAKVQLPLVLDSAKFKKHYETRLALPYPVQRNLTPAQVARFQEQTTDRTGVDLEIQSTRVYPFEAVAAHIIGFLRRDDSSAEGEESFFSYWMPDYRGVLGIEAGYDSDLRGRAGGKSVLVNNIGYRQTENVWRPAEPGKNVRLTLDLDIQSAAEKALATRRGAAVVMDVNSGDLVAMVSTPAPNPNHFINGFPPGERNRLIDPKLRPQINRATQAIYAPGSVFKIVTALAALESGLNPNALTTVRPNPADPSKGMIYVGKRSIKDTAEPGQYNFRRAFIKSSNSYFVEHGLDAGIDRIIRLAEQFHFGERIGLPTRQELSGTFPQLGKLRPGWSDGDTANICIGQGEMTVTPLQVAVMTAAIANGGKVLWPRLVISKEPSDPLSTDSIEQVQTNRVRTVLNVRQQNLALIRAAMAADVEDPIGTGKEAAIPGYRVCGKTGTAQVENSKGVLIDHITWFASFAPFENPRYAVVVMVESGTSGGGTCAPIARDIYEAIVKRDKPPGAPLASQEARLSKQPAGLLASIRKEMP